MPSNRATTPVLISASAHKLITRERRSEKAVTLHDPVDPCGNADADAVETTRRAVEERIDGRAIRLTTCDYCGGGL